ncbi:MAG: O-antigen ligase family protein [Pyrinomonadaceae bacterium]|nr:O-antigen ligase family protein [Pyrinomonadaceae bacterium]
MEIDSRSFDYEPVKPSRINRRAREQANSVSELGQSQPPLSKNRADSLKETGLQEVAPALPKDEPLPSKTEVWSVRRGHTFSFIALFVYVAIAYFRPYELTSALSWTVWLPFWLGIAMLASFIVTQLTIEGNLTARPREVNLVLLLTVTAVLSIPVAASAFDAWDTFSKVFIKTVLLFIIMINVMRTERRLKLMLFLALAAGFYMSALALQNYGAATPAPTDIARAKATINNMFGEPNAMALHLVTMIPIAIAMLLASSNILKKVLYGGGALLMIAGNFTTQSRGGFLGIVAAGSVLAWKLGRRNRFLMIGVLVIAVAATFAFAPGGYGERMSTILNPDSESSATSRRELLKRSLLMTAANPVFGIGIGNFPIVGQRGQTTHNAYTQVAAEMGVAAFILYVLFLVAGYKRLRRMERETIIDQKLTRYYYLTVGLQASLAGYLVGSFFLSVAYDWYVYFIIGYAICFHRIYDLRETVDDAQVETTDERLSNFGLKPSA